MGSRTGYCENITVASCTLQSASADVRVGYGRNPVRNCVLRNLVIYNSHCGLGVFAGPLARDWGGNGDLRPSSPASEQLFRHDIAALFFRHATGLRLDGVDVKWRGELPEFYTSTLEFERCAGRITGFTGSVADSKRPAIVRHKSRVELRC